MLALAVLAAVARTAPSQVEALWQLYQLAGGANWRSNHGWAPDGDPCAFDRRWAGVGCTDPCQWHDGPSCAYGMVTALTLDYNGLAGNLSDWHNLSALTNLTVLDLSGNELTGELPTQLGRIETLRSLLAPLNQLAGTLPTQLGAINSRWGVEDLLELNLRGNIISGTLPTELGAHTRLRAIDLRENQLSGSVPALLVGGMTELSSFHAHNNPLLSGTLPSELGNLASLRYLDLSRTSISGSLPSSIGGLPLLTALHMDGNRLSGSIPDELTALGMLRTLRLPDNNLNGTLPVNIGELRSLQVLDVYNNSMEGDVPASISQLLELRELYLDKQHLLPLRRKYCGQRLPDVGKYSWRVLRDEYDLMMASYCPDGELLSTEHTFGRLQDILPPDEL